MNETLKKFIVPPKTEGWRFSGLKEMDFGSYVNKGSTPISSNTKDMVVHGKSGEDSIEMPGELARPFHNFGSAALEKETLSGGFWYAKTLPGRQGKLYVEHTHLKENSLLNARTLVEVEENTQLNFIETLKALAGNSSNLTATRIRVKKNATLSYVLWNKLPLDAKNFNFLEIEAHENARVNLTIINLGSAYTRQEITAFIKGEGANVNLRSLSIVDGAREVDQRTLQIHEAPNAKSDLLFKNVLNDSARTIFSGLIRVAPGAQKTDAYQKNRNLLLSDEANANSLPGLEIEANDVRCTHGATCGKLDEEELFYLRARGIGEKDAKQMLVGGYCEEILAGLPEDVAEVVRATLAV